MDLWMVSLVWRGVDLVRGRRLLLFMIGWMFGVKFELFDTVTRDCVSKVHSFQISVKDDGEKMTFNGDSPVLEM